MWDPFDELLSKPSHESIAIFEREYERTGQLGHLSNLVLALLDIGSWRRAKDICEKIINNREYSGDGDFIMLGIAYWCMGNTSSAIDTWKQSINTQYALCPGAPDTPLLLWYAGQRLNDGKLIKQSLKKIKRYWKVPDYKVLSGWMGTVAIAGLLMDKVPANIFLHEWKDEEKGVIEDRRLCRAHFWIGMKCLEEGDETTATSYFKSAFSGNKIAILQYEYFLAKWEYSRLTGKNIWGNSAE